MYGISEIATSGTIALVACGLSVPLLKRLSGRLGLVDMPGGRKQHNGRVPIVGGLSIYVSVLIAGVLMGFDISFFLPMLLGLPILISGLIDDRRSLTPAARIPIQIISSLAMIYIGQIVIENVGDIAGAGQVVLVGWGASLFTVICAVGVINSINMIDGVDGLSGSLIALSLLPLVVYADVANDGAAVALLVSLITAIVAFLFYNARLVRKCASVFLGDAGSTFLGFVLVWYLIKFTQGEQAVLSPVSAGWILGLPLADTVVVILRRVLDKKSPFAPDRNHLHHRLLDAGLGVRITVFIMLGFHVVFIAIGIASNIYGGLEPVFFWAFVLTTVVHFLYTPRAIAHIAELNVGGKRLVER